MNSDTPTLRHSYTPILHYSHTPIPLHCSDTPTLPHSDTSYSPPPTGVALVLVLGVLTVMVIMAVAFSISMRTERVAASNYADIVKARQLVYVGLARAMEHIQADMGTDLWHTGAQVYPAWGVTKGSTSSNWNEFTNIVDFLTGEAANFIPRALWQEATTTNAANAPTNWIGIWCVETNFVVEITTNGSVVTNIIGTNILPHLRGRVAYMVINCSGLLDANYVGGLNGGGLIPRDLGTNPNEIAIANLTDFNNAVTFIDNRANKYIRYETLPELYELNKACLGFPSNLCVYSYFPAGYWNANAIPPTTSMPTYIGGSVDDLVTEQQPFIIEGFTNSGFTDAQAGILYSNLVDCVDGDIVPSNFTTCVEPVPMINEIVFQSKQSYEPGPPEKYFITNTVSYELWYPFVSGGGTFSFTCSVDFVSSLPATISVGGVESDIAVSPSLPFAFVSFANNAVLLEDPVSFTPTLVSTEVKDGDDTVDALKSSSPLPGISVTPNGPAVAIECRDPRFNWDPTDGSRWRMNASPTLMNSNIWTTNYLAITPDSDGDTAMYVANQSLRSVGELGYLVYDDNEPWKTVKLYGTNAHRVLDTFTMSTNASRRGLVNPNSEVTNVLAAVFAEMPVDLYPDDPAGPANRLSMTDAGTFAGRIYDDRPYTNLSEMGRGLADTDFNGLPSVSIDNELQRESFIRNTAGLFSTRQNLFTIIIEAQPGRGDFIPSYPAKQRAVALVWRDPFTGECFVRSIKWLGD